MQKYFITGGAGFIGSSMADRLIEEGNEVCVYDNFSTGHRPFLKAASTSPNFSLVEGDLLDLEKLKIAMKGSDFVYHFAANADVRFGVNYPARDLEQNTVATFNVLEAMRLSKIRGLGFSSTGSIYGEPDIFPTPEDAPFPAQTSLYGASKLAGEGLISAYCNSFGISGVSFRFVSVLGERYTHGHVFDFCKSLLKNPHSLNVLGDGKQSKSYIYVQDCIDAMRLVEKKHANGFEVYNLAVDNYIEVNQSINWITDTMGLHPKLIFKGGKRGWIGDSPFIFLDTTKIRTLGWKPKHNIETSVKKTIKWLLENQWALERN